MNWSTVKRSDISNHPNSLQGIIDGDIDGITVTDILSEEELQYCIKNIHKNFNQNTSNHHYTEIENDSQLGANDDFEKYLDQSNAHSQNVIHKLGLNFSELFHELFTALSNLKVEVPMYHNTPYKSCVVKIWNEGQELLPHYDAGVQESSEGIHLSALGDTHKIISFVLMLQTPDNGGDLIIYDLNYDDTPAVFKPLSPVAQQFMKAYIDKHQIQRTKIAPKENSLVVFAGGRNWHSVSPVEGARARISVGGLIMPSFDNRQLYFWG